MDTYAQFCGQTEVEASSDPIFSASEATCVAKAAGLYSSGKC